MKMGQFLIENETTIMKRVSFVFAKTSTNKQINSSKNNNGCYNNNTITKFRKLKKGVFNLTQTSMYE
jgi:hypothetical protein